MIERQLELAQIGNRKSKITEPAVGFEPTTC